MTTPAWDVLGFGAVAVDELIHVDEYPQPDTKTPIRERRRTGGGLAGTALVAAARLGARAAYCGVLGDDEWSRFTLAELEREGVDCSLVLRQAEARPIYALAIVDRSTGSRTLLYDRSGTREPPLEMLTRERIAACRVLFVDFTVMGTALHLAPVARSLGIPLVADLEPGVDERLEQLLPQIDHLIIGTELGRSLTGAHHPAEMARALSVYRQAAVVVTAGAQGCWYAPRGEAVRHCPALRVQVVDTLGCGDVFHGAYAASLARGEDVHTAVQVATIAAGLKTTQPGGRAGIPTRAQVEAHLRKPHHASQT